MSRGELLVSLSYQPVSHRLSVVVLKAKHLPKLDITGLSGSKYNVFKEVSYAPKSAFV